MFGSQKQRLAPYVVHELLKMTREKLLVYSDLTQAQSTGNLAAVMALLLLCQCTSGSNADRVETARYPASTKT